MHPLPTSSIANGRDDNGDCDYDYDGDDNNKTCSTLVFPFLLNGLALAFMPRLSEAVTYSLSFCFSVGIYSKILSSSNNDNKNK